MLVHFDFVRDQLTIVWSTITQDFTSQAVRSHVDLIKDDAGSPAGVIICHCAFEVTGLDTARRGFTKVLDLRPYAGSDIPLHMLKAHATNSDRKAIAAQPLVWQPSLTGYDTRTDRQRNTDASQHTRDYYDCWNERTNHKNVTHRNIELAPDYLYASHPRRGNKAKAKAQAQTETHGQLALPPAPRPIHELFTDQEPELRTKLRTLPRRKPCRSKIDPSSAGKSRPDSHPTCHREPAQWLSPLNSCVAPHAEPNSKTQETSRALQPARP